ncbi:MAG TPA: RDD family protein, partial [Agriterribacter sp.]|nr:RDD family protein [Agriterribacter sp.]
FTYHFFCELFWNGQSVGKKLLGLRVVNDNGGKASPGQYMIRWLLRSSDLSVPVIIIAIVFGWIGALKALWITTLMFIADLVLVAVHKKSKRLGDLAAGTLLIKANPKGNLEDTIFMEVSDNYVPVFPQVMRLSDRDVNTVKGILDTGRKTGHTQMVENASARVKNVLAIQSNMPAFDFLETLLKDYNYLSTKA